MVRKKKEYKITKTVKSGKVAGIKVTMQQSTIIKTYLWGLIKIRKRKDIYLWYPAKGKFSNPNVRKNSWIILKQDFEEVSPTAIKVKGICHNPEILKQLSQIIKK